MNELRPTDIDICVQQMGQGNEAARTQLLELANDRLVRLTRKMLDGFPMVRRWEQTDDVWQNASLRLWRSLEAVQPENARHFFRLAAVQIRRELIDLARRHGGPLGLGARHATAPDSNDSAPDPAHHPADETYEPMNLACWTELHHAAGELPEDECEVFELLWYHGLKQSAAATLLEVSERTIKRRWQSARLRLFERLNREPPS